ncbi:hypothetical protein BWI17_00380 [Betaproteobacteria bacterium GR16-43]|nr:hypothetical protein BWI17_00380 [Betaproteobacteria bacterium GR16-43]
MTPFKLILLGFSALAGLLAGPARAFILFPEVYPVPVIEYYNPATNHYFLTIDYNEITGLDAGLAGPWTRTGNAFLAFPLTYNSGERCPAGGCGEIVTRFYGTPGLGPNSHFYTLVLSEVDGLKQPGTGWSFEKQAFRMRAPTNGVCPASTVPVYRLYNNRWMYNDSNHRYVTKQALRAKMVSLGWIDEGVQMCSPGEAIVALETQWIGGDGNEFRVQEGDRCASAGSCVLARGITAPTTRFLVQSLTVDQANNYLNLTTGSGGTLLVAPGATADNGYQQSFIMGNASTAHIYLNSVGTTGALSNFDLAYRMPEGKRFFPWARDREVETELSLSTSVAVTTVAVRTPGSAAYGHPSVEFTDARSGRSFRFNVVAYGTIPFAGDFVGVDPRDGKPFLATSFRTTSPFLRSLGANAIDTPPGSYLRVASSATGWFEYRVNADEFARVLASARTVDGQLSSDPADYYVDNFRFTNEVFGEGALGVTVYSTYIIRYPRN